MTVIRLPDGSERRYEKPVTVGEVASSIGAGLARAALAGKVNGKLVDMSSRVEADSELKIVTEKDAEGLEIIRHSTAHLLAHAVKELFPDAQVTIGPVIEDGFYYDFSYKRPFTPEDLAAMEKRMAEISARDLKVERRVWGRSDAINFFKNQGEHYKAQIIESIPGRRGCFTLFSGQFYGLMPGSARTHDFPAQGVQIDEAGRGVLARRFAQRNATADLWHGLGQKGRSGCLSAPP